MDVLTIEPSESGKGREFSAHLLGYARADQLWPAGRANTDVVRPILMALAGTDHELRAFAANLQMGRRACIYRNKWDRRRPDAIFEVLRTSGCQFSWQRSALGSVLTIFAPELLQPDPGAAKDGADISFVALPAAAWEAEQVQHLDVSGAVRSVRGARWLPASYDAPRLASLVPLAALFGCMLDRRTRLPMVQDARFYLRVMLAAMREGLATFSTPGRYGRNFGALAGLGYEECSLDRLKLSRGVAFHATQAQVADLLAQEVQRHMRRAGLLAEVE